jgi:aquaporin Z
MSTTTLSIMPKSEADLVLAWRPRWRLYAVEATLLGTFMISACFFVFLLEHSASPLHGTINSALLRRACVGLAMGLTAIALIYSPPGKRSGAHMNPAMTLSFFRLGRMDPRDAAGYIASQFIGAAAGVALMTVTGNWVGDPSVRFVVTTPGAPGFAAAWIAEFMISFALVSVVLSINKIPRLAPYTGCFAGLLVATYITLEAPISGMSMNPARTFGSSLVGHIWSGWWIYLTAPIAGMLVGVEIHLRLSRRPDRLCGKLSHSRHTPCFFKCSCLQPQA